MDSPDGLNKAVQKLDRIENKIPKGWTLDQWDTYINSQRADISREIARNKAAKAEVSKEALIALKQYSTAKSLGYEIDPNEKLRVESLVDGDEKLQPLLDRVNKTAAFSVSNLSDRTALLDEAETGQLDDVDDYAAILKANGEINKLAQDDGMTLGIQQGIIKDPVQFDPSNPESLRALQEQANLLSEHYGVPVSPLTDPVATALAKSINTMTVDEKITLANTLSVSPDVWGQISKKNQKAFALAGATGDPAYMGAVFTGQEMMAAGLVKAPKAADYLPVLNEYVGDVYGTDDKQGVMEAAKAHYVATAEDGEEFDKEAFKKSLKDTTGGIAEVNNYLVELPRGVDESIFDDWMDEFTPEMVAALGGGSNRTNEEAAININEGRIKNVKGASNEYIVMADEIAALIKPDGTPFIISWTPEATADIQANRFIEKRKRRESRAGEELQKQMEKFRQGMSE